MGNLPVPINWLCRISEKNQQYGEYFTRPFIVGFFFSKKCAFYATTGDDKHCFLYQQHYSSIISNIISASIHKNTKNRKHHQLQPCKFSWRNSAGDVHPIFLHRKIHLMDPPLGDHHDCHRSVGCCGFLHSWTLRWWPEGGGNPQTTRETRGKAPSYLDL